LAFLVNNPPNEEMNDVLSMLIRFKENHKDKYHKISILDAIGNYEDQRTHDRFFSYFAEIRNKWLTLLDDDDTHIFSVDSDILLPSNSLRRLLNWDLDIVSGLIYNGPDESGNDSFNFMSKTSDQFPNGDYAYIHRHPAFLESRAKWEQDPKTRLYKMTHPAEVAMSGAIILIKRDVIDAGVHYGYKPQGEDIFFSEEAIKRGFKIHCDSSLRPNHIRDPMDLHQIINIPAGMIVKPPYISRKAPEPQIPVELTVIGEY
jgi:hypothetical protein